MTDRLSLRQIRIPFGILGWFIAAVSIGLIVGAVAWQTTLFCLLAVVSFWLGLCRRDWGLGLLALTIPMQTHAEIGIQTDTVTWTKIVVWSLLIGWMVALLVTRQRVLIDFVTVSIFVLVGVLAFSVWNARNIDFWMAETYRWLVTAIVSCFAFNTFRRRGSPLPFLLGSFVGVSASVVLAIWQVIEVSGPESFEVRGFLRAYGPFTHPNQFALYLELVGPLFLALWIGSHNRWRTDSWWRLSDRLRHVWAFGIAFTVLGIILSQSRGGLIGMSIGIASVIVLSRSTLRLPLVHFAPIGFIGAIAFLTIAIGLVAAGSATFIGRETLVTPANFAVQERLSHWAAAIEMAKAHPFLGVGAGNFDVNYRDATQIWRFRIGRGHAHDTYLHFLAQSGVIGLTVYIILLLGVFLIIVRTLRILPEGSRLAMLLGVAGVTAAIGTHAIFEYVHVLSLNLQIVVIWAMAAAIGAEAWSERERVT